jgi:CheY-like chemotaxis protein
MAANRTIFYAEDDPDDFEMVRDSFAKYPDINLIQCRNGQELVNLLQQQGPSALPCLIILDMNMPVMDGRQALVQIRKEELYRKIPVVVFTTSSSQLDQFFAKSYQAQFITKPQKAAEALNVADQISTLCGVYLSTSNQKSE